MSANGQDASLSFDETSRASEPQATPGGTPAERLEGPDQSRWDKYERRIGKPLEHMTPKELVVYMETFHRETNDISKHSGPAGVTTMKKFQEDYGSTHTAELFRYLFEDDGVWEISSGNKEPVTHIHFSENLRWWIEKVDGERQLKTKSKRDFDSKYTFATSLTPDDDLVFATEL